MLVNPKGEVLEDMPFFNAAFMRDQNVKSFRGNYSTKFDHDIIRPNDDSFVYEFDKLGQLVRKYKILLNDTLISTYQYDYRGNVVVHREKNKFGYHEHRFKYDDRDRMIEMELRRDKVSNYNKLSFELQEENVVAIERYEYIPLEGIDYKKVCYNGAGRVYRIEFFYFNSDKKLSKVESALHNGTGRKEINYFYNEQGLIEEVKTISKASKKKQIRQKLFTYDEEGNVLSRMIYRNDELISEEQLVYFEDTKLLKAVISRTEENKLVILQFKSYRRF